MHRYVPLPFHAERFATSSSGRVTVAKNAVAAEVDLATGTVISKPQQSARRDTIDDSIALAGLNEQLLDGPQGKVTQLTDATGHSFRFTGTWEFMARDGDAMIGIVSTARLRYDCLAISLGARALLRLPGSSEAKVALEGSLGACATIDTLHVFRLRMTSLQSVSIAIPPTGSPDLIIRDGHLCALAGDKLLIVDPEDLPFRGTHVTAPVEYNPFVGRGQGDPEPAKVVVVFSEKILVDHPRLKRLTLSRPPASPELERGDSILIDDVREELPGIFRVYAWRKQGAEQSTRPPPPIVGFAAPNVRPVSESDLAR